MSLPEPEPGRTPRFSRRELLRRGAVVGGTLMWATPAIQSLAPPAYAQYALCGCCYCWNGDRQSPTNDACFDNGATGFLADADSCQRWCETGTPSGPYTFSEHCSASTSCVCNRFGSQQPTGCTCF
jgi:hypothetical protein